MTAESRGWGPPGLTRSQLVKVPCPGIQLNIRREVAPLVAELIRRLNALRAEHGRVPLSSSGGYVKRKIAGSSAWSEHSWGLAVDFLAATNPHRRPLTTDMPPGTDELAASLGFEWGGTWSKPDPMHFEFAGTPEDAARRVAALTAPTKPAVTKPPTPQQQEDDAMQLLVWDTLDGKVFVIDPITDMRHPVSSRVLDLAPPNLIKVTTAKQQAALKGYKVAK